MWTEIITRSPDLQSTMNPPATPDEIAVLEQRVGAPLPEAFKQYLATANGQNDLGDEHGLYEMNRFLPVHAILEAMDSMEAMWGDEDPIDHITENKIRPVFWDPLWIPFAAFQDEPRLILDLNPGRNGVHGQVLHHFPGVDLEADDTVIAASFAEFSAQLLRDAANPPTS